MFKRSDSSTLFKSSISFFSFFAYFSKDVLKLVTLFLNHSLAFSSLFLNLEKNPVFTGKLFTSFSINSILRSSEAEYTFSSEELEISSLVDCVSSISSFSLFVSSLVSCVFENSVFSFSCSLFSSETSSISKSGLTKASTFALVLSLFLSRTTLASLTLRVLSSVS